jgi:hypothetical protein
MKKLFFALTLISLVGCKHLGYVDNPPNVPQRIQCESAWVINGSRYSILVDTETGVKYLASSQGGIVVLEKKKVD